MIRRLLFHNFHAVYRLDRWIKRRFTPLGMLLLGTLVASAVYGINTRATLSYQLFGLALTFVAIAIASAATFRARFGAERRLPRYATVGEPLRYTVEITNLGARRRRGLLAEEELDGGRPSSEEFARAREPAASGRNWFDRAVGYPRWSSLMRRRVGAFAPEAALPDLPPRQAVRVELEMTPVRRGYVRVRGLRIARPDPLGIFKAHARAAGPGAVLVLPRRFAVSWVELQGTSRDRVGGSSQSASVGGAEEFAALREYRPGDPMRHIDWKGWARIGTPIVKEYHEECFVRQALVLDTFAAPDAGPGAFEAAVSAAASFATTAPLRGGALDLMFVGTEAFVLSAGPGLASTDRLLEALACVEPTPERPDRPFRMLHEQVVAHAGEMSACVCVLLAWDAPRRALVEALRSLGVPVLALVAVEDDAPATLDPGPLAAEPQRLHALRAGHAGADLAALGAGGVR